MRGMRGIIRYLIRESLGTLLVENYIDINDVQDVFSTGGSTHRMLTCKLDGDKYYLKFSEEDLFDVDVHPSLQILVEYLAYSVYALYAGISIPRFQLIFDADNDVVGLATSEVRGRQALGRVRPVKLGEMMSVGVYVDIFLANWDVIGTGTGNVFVDDSGEKVTRIDPGGALTFRAQGGRKGVKFNATASELKTMLDPDFGAGEVFSYSDLKVAADEFLRVPADAINVVLNDVYNNVKTQLDARGMHELSRQWQAEVKHIVPIMKKRWMAVAKHAGMISGKGLKR